MSFFDTLILDMIIVFLPISLILIAQVHNRNMGRMNKDYLIDVATLAILFLLIKYCNFDETYGILLINIPFILSLSYKRKSASVLIAFIIMIYYYLNGYSFDVVLIEYIIYIEKV